MPNPGTVYGPAVVDDYSVEKPVPDWERESIEVSAPFEVTDMAEDLRKWVFAMRNAYGESRKDGKILLIDAGSYIKWGERLHTVLLRQEQAIQRLTRPKYPVRRWWFRKRMRFGRWLRALGRRIS